MYSGSAVSRLVAKLMLALLMLPTAAVLYIVCFVFAMETVGWGMENFVFSTLGIIGGGYVFVYWLLLWRTSVKWTRRRILLTAGVTVLAILVGALAGSSLGAILDEPSFGIFAATIIVIPAWLLGTIFVWRETNSERMARIRAAGGEAISCISCGYNLTGLKHTTCPECGAKPTIEELLAGQPARAEHELEDAKAE